VCGLKDVADHERTSLAGGGARYEGWRGPLRWIGPDGVSVSVCRRSSQARMWWLGRSRL
jgi:hypothetical protein